MFVYHTQLDPTPGSMYSFHLPSPPTLFFHFYFMFIFLLFPQIPFPFQSILMVGAGLVIKFPKTLHKLQLMTGCSSSFMFKVQKFKPHPFKRNKDCSHCLLYCNAHPYNNPHQLLDFNGSYICDALYILFRFYLRQMRDFLTFLRY